MKNLSFTIFFGIDLPPLIKRLGRVCGWCIAFCVVISLLLGCSGLSGGDTVRASTSLPGVNPIQAVNGVPIKRRVRAARINLETQGSPQISVWLYASLASQAHLMTLQVDPTSGTRIWENYLRTNKIPFARVTKADDLSRVSSPGLLILGSTVVLSDVEKQALLEWRNRGGAILSTWLTGTHSPSGESIGFDFMRDVLDVKVFGNTQDEVDDTFMIVHGDNPISNSLIAGTRVWLHRIPNQLPLRFAGNQVSAQIMNWSRGFSLKTPAGLISYNERKMSSGLNSRVVAMGYPEQNWQRSDPVQLNAITGDIFSWLLRQPRAYLGAWPYPYQSATLVALQAAEQVSSGEVEIAKTLSDMGGKATVYISGSDAEKTSELINKIQTFGHEIAYFGDTFEGFKGQPEVTQANRLDKMQKQFSEAGVSAPMPASFSAPIESYDATTQRLLIERKFDNYLAFMDSSQSSLPFFASKKNSTEDATVVLPRTITGPEVAIEEDPAEGLSNFLAELELSDRMGAMSVVRIPAQSLLMPDERTRILEKMKSMSNRVWIASAKQIAQWWRDRDQVVINLKAHPQGYILSATVARSVNVKWPLSILVNLPNTNSRIRIEALNKGDKLPKIMAVDPWRVSLTLSAPAAGQYEWLLKFEESVDHAKR